MHTIARAIRAGSPDLISLLGCPVGPPPGTPRWRQIGSSCLCATEPLLDCRDDLVCEFHQVALDVQIARSISDLHNPHDEVLEYFAVHGLHPHNQAASISTVRDFWSKDSLIADSCGSSILPMVCAIEGATTPGLVVYDLGRQS
jgi:hypothetical protein